MTLNRPRSDVDDLTQIMAAWQGSVDSFSLRRKHASRASAVDIMQYMWSLSDTLQVRNFVAFAFCCCIPVDLFCWEFWKHMKLIQSEQRQPKAFWRNDESCAATSALRYTSWFLNALNKMDAGIFRNKNCISAAYRFRYHSVVNVGVFSKSWAGSCL